MWPLRSLTVLGTAAFVAGCSGDAVRSTVPCTPAPVPSTSPAQVTAGAVTVSADRGVVAAGESVTLSVTVTGPAQLHTDCAAPVAFTVVDGANLHVFSTSPAGTGGTPCGDVTLPAGHTLAYELRWTPDVTLPSGAYSTVVTVGNLPDLTVPLVLGSRPGEGC